MLKQIAKRLRPAKPEPLKIPYSPPPDGSYPPRLLAQIRTSIAQVTRSSLWLNDGETFELVGGQASVTRSGNIFTIQAQSSLQPEVYVNGHPLVARLTLRDGDFIFWKQNCWIFQEDPVHDRKRRMSASGMEMPQVDPSKWLEQNIVINEEGLSIDAGKHFACWDQLTMLEVQGDPQSGLFHMAMHYKNSDGTYKKVTKGGTAPGYITDLMKWLHIIAPFDLSFFEFNIKPPFSVTFPDAYLAAAWEKIIDPAQNKKGELPTDKKIILGIASRWKFHLETAMILSGGILFLAVVLLSFDFIDKTVARFLKNNFNVEPGLTLMAWIILITAVAIGMNKRTEIKQWIAKRRKSSEF